MEYQADLDTGQSQKKKNKELVKKLKRIPEKKLDRIFNSTHEKVFSEIDCLSCANCCKTTSPIFRDVDIKRLAQHFKIKSADFIERYLRIDEEDDYVLQQAPCPFLLEDNKCSVYEQRPLACQEYPHTNRKKMYQILNLTRKNTEICPAVSRIFENIKQKHVL